MSQTRSELLYQVQKLTLEIGIYECRRLKQAHTRFGSPFLPPMVVEIM